jgi:hypothetical protein
MDDKNGNKTFQKGRTRSYVILNLDELMIEHPVLNGCECWLGADVTQT